MIINSNITIKEEGGDYNITATINQDDTQDLAIVDAVEVQPTPIVIPNGDSADPVGFDYWDATPEELSSFVYYSQPQYAYVNLGINQITETSPSTLILKTLVDGVPTDIEMTKSGTEWTGGTSIYAGISKGGDYAEQNEYILYLEATSISAYTNLTILNIVDSSNNIIWQPSVAGTIDTTKSINAVSYNGTEIPLAGGGGGGDSGGQYLVRVIDYDGTVLKQDHLDTGATFDLPSNPSHTGLVFQNWSSPVTITSNSVTVGDSDITIGATYTTASGLSEFDIELTTVTGLTVNLNMDGTKDWGDGTSDTTTTHTYTSVGSYTITCDGTTMTTSSSRGLFGQGSSSKNYYVKNVRLANIIYFGNYAFSSCSSLTSITIPSGVTSLTNSAFQQCYSLKSITIPSGVWRIRDYSFQQCYSLTSIAIPNSVTDIGTTLFNACSSLTSITIPSGVTSLANSLLSQCSSLTSITIPNSVTSIVNFAFQYCYSILEYDFSNHTAVPTLSNTNAFANINKICKIKVPSALYNDWIVATNWSTYADYIVAV